MSITLCNKLFCVTAIYLVRNLKTGRSVHKWRPLNSHNGQLSPFNIITWLHKYRPTYTKQALAPPLEGFPSKILTAFMVYLTTASVGQVRIQVFTDVEKSTRGSFPFLSYLRVVYLFNVYLRCLVCIVVSCLLYIVVVVLCVLLSSYVYLLYYVSIAVFTLDAGLLARSQNSEGPVTGHLDSFFLVSLFLKANAEMVPKIPSCHYMLLT